MTKKMEDSVSVRIPQQVLDEIEELIYSMPRPRPSRGEIVVTAWQHFRGRPPAEKPPPAPHDKIPDALRPLLDRLIDILVSGDETIIRAIEMNLNLFHDLLQKPAEAAREKSPHRRGAQK